MANLQDCTRCERLAHHLGTLRTAFPEHHCRPVGAWGRPRAPLLIVGLAPGRTGANRTGRPFVGDASGRVLFAAMAATGFADALTPTGAQLVDARLTNAVKCLPPGNRPTAAEVRTCGRWLDRELDQHLGRRPRVTRVVLCLGQIAWQATGASLARLERAPPELPRFGHAVEVPLGRRQRLVASYHPSRQNVNTGRLTHAMLTAVLERCRALITDDD